MGNFTLENLSYGGKGQVVDRVAWMDQDGNWVEPDGVKFQARQAIGFARRAAERPDVALFFGEHSGRDAAGALLQFDVQLVVPAILLDIRNNKFEKLLI